jgi:cytochrome o ubiquinol oxidase subunit 2
MKRRRGQFWTPWRIVASIAGLLVIGGLVATLYLQGKNLGVLDPAGSVGVKEKNLMIVTLLLSAIVVIPVYVMLIVFPIRYREGNHKAVYTPEVDGNRWLETLWWGIPIVIIGILGVITWVSSHELDPGKALASNVPPIRVQVVALQWKWLFLYPDQRIATVNELKIPAGTPVNFQITADAPMSGFWIPQLGTQTYAMTGMSMPLHLVADHPGTYRGTNSNINGKGYADMSFDVVALDSRRDFDDWVKSIVDSPKHNHIEWTEYQQLVKPNIPKTVTYYHLHDDNLYTRIVKQYMHGGQDAMSSGASAHELMKEGN